jgi:hypothetical protein
MSKLTNAADALAKSLRAFGAPSVQIIVTPHESPDAMLDLATAAELLGYKPAGLRKVVKAGQIRFVQNGRGPIKFRREWIDEYIHASNPTKVKRSPSQRRPALPQSKVPGFNPSLFKT